MQSALLFARYDLTHCTCWTSITGYLIVLCTKAQHFANTIYLGSKEMQHLLWRNKIQLSSHSAKLLWLFLPTMCLSLSWLLSLWMWRGYCSRTALNCPYVVKYDWHAAPLSCNCKLLNISPSFWMTLKMVRVSTYGSRSILPIAYEVERFLYLNAEWSSPASNY